MDLMIQEYKDGDRTVKEARSFILNGDKVIEYYCRISIWKEEYRSIKEEYRHLLDNGVNVYNILEIYQEDHMGELKEEIKKDIVYKKRIHNNYMTMQFYDPTSKETVEWDVDYDNHKKALLSLTNDGFIFVDKIKRTFVSRNYNGSIRKVTKWEPLIVDTSPIPKELWGVNQVPEHFC